MSPLPNILRHPLFTHSLNYRCFTPIPKQSLWCLTPPFAQENISSATEKLFSANLLHAETETSLTPCYHFQRTYSVYELMIHIPNLMLFSNYLGGSNKFAQLITNTRDLCVQQEMTANYVIIHPHCESAVWINHLYWKQNRTAHYLSLM